MPLLAIETSARQLGVAVLDGERILSSYEVLADYTQAVELPGAVARVLKDARTTLQQLEAIIVDIGPGSFTGLRIGLAFAKGLAFSTKKPLVGVPSLEVLASGLPLNTELVCPVVDAKQKNVYAAQYRLESQQPQRQGDYFLGPVDVFLMKLAQPAVFLGDGCALYREKMIDRLGMHAAFVPQEFWWPRVATLARLGGHRFAQGQRDDPAHLVPLYLYPLDCSVRGPNRPTAILPKAVQAA